MLPAAREALRESKARLEVWDGIEGGGYRALARLHKRGEIERQVAARLAARGIGPDGADLKTGKKPKAR